MQRWDLSHENPSFWVEPDEFGREGGVQGGGGGGDGGRGWGEGFTAGVEAEAEPQAEAGACQLQRRRVGEEAAAAEGVEEESAVERPEREQARRGVGVPAE